jgi:hypothetical protein
METVKGKGVNDEEQTDDDRIAEMISIYRDLKATWKIRDFLLIIQDLERHINQESTNKPITAETNHTFHFLLKGERKDITIYKLLTALNHLQKISPECKSRYDLQFAGVIDYVIPTLTNLNLVEPTTLTGPERTSVDAWFT